MTTGAHPGDRTTPVIHLTDLYHPPQDPDDTLDLACLHALPELDVRAVVLDPTRRFLRPASIGGADLHREPGLVPVAQLQQISGRSYPVAIGPVDPLRHPGDDCRDRSLAEQAGVELILRELRRAETPVLVSVVSSLRPLAAAYHRDPGLCREKIARVLVNAGNSADGAELEWNVTLDVHAYVTLWLSGLPIDWYPCTGAGGSFAVEEHNTFWSADHAVLLDGLPAPLAAWIHHSFAAGGRSDPFRALSELGSGEPWRLLLAGTRNMWSTASLVAAAGRELVHEPAGWRFRPAGGSADPVHRLLPVAVTVDEGGRTTWHEDPASPHRITTRDTGFDHDGAMTEALRALLDAAPWELPPH